MKRLNYFFAILFFSINLSAQEVGISPVKIWTDNSEFENPIGYSIYYFQPIWKFGIKAEYVTAKNEREYYGFLVSGFVGPGEYNRENVFSKSSFRAIEVSLFVPNVIQIESNNLNFGLGITFDKFDLEREGLTSGKKSKFWTEKKCGIFYAISVSRENLFELPLKIELLFKHKQEISFAFVTDVEQPFNGIIDIKELQFNFAIMF